MLSLSRALTGAAVAFVLATTFGCAATSNEDTESATADITTGLHEPQGEERKAIHAAFRRQLATDLNGQSVAFNSREPVGRYLAHGDWAYFEGILEGPNGNTQPIDYNNSKYAEDFKHDWLDGVIRNGNFAAKFLGVAHREADGTWSIPTYSYPGGDPIPAYAVGPGWDAWESWASIPPPAFRDVFVEFPIDDLHAPEGAERGAILKGLSAQITADVNGQQVFFNATDPVGTFLVHDNWAYFSGIIEGPNGNTTPVNYQNSVYSPRSGGVGFKGVLRNGNFAAVCSALLQKQADGSWKIVPTTSGDYSTPGYAVGSSDWVGSPTSRFAWDIFGNGRGEGDGDGEGGPVGDGR